MDSTQRPSPQTAGRGSRKKYVDGEVDEIVKNIPSQT